MRKKILKKPYSFSFSPGTIDNLKQFRNTNPEIKLSALVEEYLIRLIPAFNSKE